MERERPERDLTPAEYITEQWNKIVGPLLTERQKPQADFILDETLQAYADEARAYHTLTHIADCLQKLEPYKDRSDYRELWLALLWHDLVYDTHATDNEEQSADRASDYMWLLGLSKRWTVSRLILATKTHKPEQEDEALVCDIDMSILAEDAEVYDAYSEGIAKEYGWVDAEAYRTGRARVLETLMGDGQVFRHPDFVHLSAKAVVNMSAERQRLIAAA